jgi:hypothetical protein
VRLADPCVHPHGAAGARGIDPGRLQRFPGALQEEAVAGVERLGLARGVAEERGVEALHVAQHRHRLDVGGVRGQLGIDAGGQHLLVGEEGDRLHAAAEVTPELVERVGAGKAAGQPDHRDFGPAPLPLFAHTRSMPVLWAAASLEAQRIG